MTDAKDIQIKPKVNTILAQFPPHLKDPANFEKIQRVVLEALAGNCSHEEMVEWAACSKCQRRFTIDRRNVMAGLGFASPTHYMIWKRIHTEIRQRVRFPKYNS